MEDLSRDQRPDAILETKTFRAHFTISAIAASKCKNRRSINEQGVCASFVTHMEKSFKSSSASKSCPKFPGGCRLQHYMGIHYAPDHEMRALN